VETSTGTPAPIIARHTGTEKPKSSQTGELRGARGVEAQFHARRRTVDGEHGVRVERVEPLVGRRSRVRDQQPALAPDRRPVAVPEQHHVDLVGFQDMDGRNKRRERSAAALRQALERLRAGAGTHALHVGIKVGLTKGAGRVKHASAPRRSTGSPRSARRSTLNRASCKPLEEWLSLRNSS